MLIAKSKVSFSVLLWCCLQSVLGVLDEIGPADEVIISGEQRPRGYRLAPKIGSNHERNKPSIPGRNTSTTPPSKKLNSRKRIIGERIKITNALFYPLCISNVPLYE